nr:MAG TPA: intron associated endonuclease [Caudoviricetes sp.]
MIRLWIYKITNDINNKIYIGQTNKPAKKRFQRHIQDAVSNRLDTHLARAIRKYGKEHFHIEVIDTA